MKKIATFTLIGIASLSANYSTAGCGSTIPHSYTAIPYPAYHPAIQVQPSRFIHQYVVQQPCVRTYYSQYPSPVFYMPPPVLVEPPFVVQNQTQIIPQPIPQVAPQTPGVVNQFQAPIQVPQPYQATPMVPQGAGPIQNPIPSQPQVTPQPQIMPQPGQPQGGGHNQFVPQAPPTPPQPQGGQPQLQNQVIPPQPQATMQAQIEAQARPITVPPAPNSVQPQPVISQSPVFGPPVIQ